MSDAYRPSAKGAFATNDLTGVRRKWNRALEEARQAVGLDIQNTRAPQCVAELEQKLERLVFAGY
jgi:hypothetical protein